MDFVIALAIVLLAAGWFGLRTLRRWRQQVRAAERHELPCADGCDGCPGAGPGGQGCTSLADLQPGTAPPVRRKP